MLFPEDDAPLLKTWIVKRIENTFVCPQPATRAAPLDVYLALPMLTSPFFLSFYRSDADSDVLADYVIALLKHDGDAESVRQLCEAEIPDFLTEGSFEQWARRARDGNEATSEEMAC